MSAVSVSSGTSSGRLSRIGAPIGSATSEDAAIDAGPVVLGDDRDRRRPLDAAGRGRGRERHPGGVGDGPGAGDPGGVLGREGREAELGRLLGLRRLALLDHDPRRGRRLLFVPAEVEVGGEVDGGDGAAASRTTTPMTIPRRPGRESLRSARPRHARPGQFRAGQRRPPEARALRGRHGGLQLGGRRRGWIGGGARRPRRPGRRRCGGWARGRRRRIAPAQAEEPRFGCFGFGGGCARAAGGGLRSAARLRSGWGPAAARVLGRRLRLRGGGRGGVSVACGTRPRAARHACACGGGRGGAGPRTSSRCPRRSSESWRTRARNSMGLIDLPKIRSRRLRSRSSSAGTLGRRELPARQCSGAGPSTSRRRHSPARPPEDRARAGGRARGRRRRGPCRTRPGLRLARPSAAPGGEP